MMNFGNMPNFSMNNNNNMMNFITNFQQLMANPAQYAMTRFGIPQNLANNPDAIIQQMMSTGQLNQAQYNAARQMASQIQNNPLFKQFVK